MNERQWGVFALVACVALFLAGCVQTAGRPEAINLLQIPAKGKAKDKALSVVQQLIKLEEEYDKETDPLEKSSKRDQFARKMIALTDQRYNKFLDSMVKGSKRFKVFSEIGGFALDAASVLVTPATTKSILASSSALTTAGKTTVNEAYFYEQTLPVIFSQMSADRQAVLADILQGLALDVNGYPLHRLLVDLQRYYAAGTIDGALQKIQRHAAETVESAEESMQELAKADIVAAKKRHEAALAQVNDEAEFDGLKNRISNWWSSFPAGKERSAQDVAIGKWATKNNMGTDYTSKGFAQFLDDLEFSETADRAMLADIARNATGLKDQP